MKLLFVNRFFFPDHSATSQILSELAFALAGRGHQIEVITSVLSYDGSRKLKRRETVRGVTVIRLPTSAFGRGKLLGRAVDYLTFYLAAFFCLMWRVRRGDVVVAKTDPPLLSLLTAPVCRLKGAASVNWHQDLFPEVAEALGLGKSAAQKTVLSALHSLRNATLRNAGMNVAIGERMASRLLGLGVPERQICIIPNWASGGLVRPVARKDNALAKEWGLEDTFVAGYSGNLGRAHDIGTFLAAIAALERHASPGEGGNYGLAREIRWLFIGGGAQMEALKREVHERKLKSILFKPYQPQELLSESLSLADVHLISLRPQLEGLIVPSKYYGIAAAGRPAIFVGDPEGEIAKTIEQSETGFVVREGDGSGLASAILTLAREPGLASIQGERARALFEARFDFPIALEAWERVLRQVLGATSSETLQPLGEAGVPDRTGAWKQL
ncbi:MAG: glycosyltransferase family 4 protein [Rhodomicrobium sp.]